MVAGIPTRILVAILLFMRWEGNVQRVIKLLEGAVFTFEIFILVWWVIAYVITPRLATLEAKDVRNAVRITRYFPCEKAAFREFINEQMGTEMQNRGG